MAWFKRVPKPIAPAQKTSRIPEGVWVKCPDCGQALYKKDLDGNLQVCPKCSHHFRLGAADRLAMLFDGPWVEHDHDLASTDPLNFIDTKPYSQRLRTAQEASGLKDAIICGTGAIDGIETEIAAMEYSFIGGSMGVVVGEKITRAIERGLQHRRPVDRRVLLRRGAHDGGHALAHADGQGQRRARAPRPRRPALHLGAHRPHDRAASRPASRCSATSTSPSRRRSSALPGPRVIEQTIRQKLPEGFQRAEFLVEHGMVDMIVDRRKLKAAIADALRFMHTPA